MVNIKYIQQDLSQLDESDNETGTSDANEEETIFELIRRVGNRPHLFDAAHPDHLKRDLNRSTWNEIAKGLILDPAKKKQATGRAVFKLTFINKRKLIN